MRQPGRFSRQFLSAALALLALPNALVAAEPDPDLTLFRDKVEPLLRERCFECHSHAADDVGGGLMLDSRSGWATGGDSGPAILPGKPEESPLIRAVRHDDLGLEMPPDGKLSEAEIAVLTDWVRRGAADPRVDGAVRQKGSIDVEAGRDFWSYRPVADIVVPGVADAGWPESEIDRFILSRLEAESLSPAPDASRAAIIRRLSFDLIGLPPTPEQIEAFENDTDPAAYERMVDALLASPCFGERWGRHWLDVARFAESVTLRGLVFKEAWRYRDYVIASMNGDVPFDQFIREQIAGDLLPASDDAERERQLVATSYLLLGNTNLEEQDKVQLRMDVVDEQLDAITRGFLAQTVTCARCHDHKFDPIPTRDYYALAGILRNSRALIDANVSQWIEVPLPAEPEVEAAVAHHAAAVADLESRIKAAKAAGRGGEVRARGALALDEVPGIVVDDASALKVGSWKDSTFSGTYVGAGYVHDENAGKGTKTITFEADLPASGLYEVWFSYDPGSSRASAVPVTVFSAEGEQTHAIDMRAPPSLGGRFLSLGRYRFEQGGQSYVLVGTDGTSGHVTPDAVAFIPEGEIAAAERRFGASVPGNTGEDLPSLEAQLKKLKANAPDRPMAMSVREEEQPADIPVHIRGSVHNLGEVVPRGFLQIATNAAPPPIPADESGRRELAEWIASPENPLTARVFVNRAWHWLMGEGIVRTVDNFGTTGETPSNPALLNFLAARFVEEGWSVKRLVRRIVLSRTYRLSVVADGSLPGNDPENRLFGRANRRRLDVECLRDAILSISGALAENGGGPKFPRKLASDYGFQSGGTERSVYLPVFRNALPPFFEAFDFADTSTVTGSRNDGTVPQQALFLMNNPFIVEQSRFAAERLIAQARPEDDRIAAVWRRTLGRRPTPRERSAVGSFLVDRPAADAWPLVFQALFASPEFRYLE